MVRDNRSRTARSYRNPAWAPPLRKYSCRIRRAPAPPPPRPKPRPEMSCAKRSCSVSCCCECSGELRRRCVRLLEKLARDRRCEFRVVDMQIQLDQLDVVPDIPPNRIEQRRIRLDRKSVVEGKRADL